MLLFLGSQCIVSCTNNPVADDGEEEQTPSDNGCHNASKVPWRVGPQLRARNAPGTVPDEEHGIDHGPLRVALDVTGCQADENRPRCGDARCLDAGGTVPNVSSLKNNTHMSGDTHEP